MSFIWCTQFSVRLKKFFKYSLLTEIFCTRLSPSASVGFQQQLNKTNANWIGMSCLQFNQRNIRQETFRQISYSKSDEHTWVFLAYHCPIFHNLYSAYFYPILAKSTNQILWLWQLLAKPMLDPKLHSCTTWNIESWKTISWIRKNT